MKQCSNEKCTQTNPQSLDCFYQNKKNKDGLQPWCKLCCSRNHAEYQIKNRDKVNKFAREWSRKNREKLNVKCKNYYVNNIDKIKDYKLRREFGITLERYEELRAVQNNACAICKQPE